MEATKIQAVQEQSNEVTSTVFVNPYTAGGTFDVAPILEILGCRGALGLGKALDEIMFELGQHYLDHGAGYNESGAHIFLLRELRNAILKGGGYIDFKYN
ncbi:hypothetical protein OB13_20350 [Pontibacter sp. HJ8]